MSIGQYLKDTQGELRHVAWPTRTQTIVFTVLVAFVSVAVALYLGFFDFLFTRALGRVIEVLPATQNPTSAIQISTGTPAQFTPAEVSTSTQ